MRESVFFKVFLKNISIIPNTYMYIQFITFQIFIEYFIFIVCFVRMKHVIFCATFCWSYFFSSLFLKICLYWYCFYKFSYGVFEPLKHVSPSRQNCLEIWLWEKVIGQPQKIKIMRNLAIRCKSANQFRRIVRTLKCCFNVFSTVLPA